MIDAYEINRLRELDALRADWRRLLSQTADYSLFHTLEWLETTWNYYPLRQRLRVVVLRQDGRLIGIVPLCVRHERRRVGTVRVLTYPLNDWGTFYGPIGPDPRRSIRAALAHVAATARDWDLIDLRWVDEAADEFLTIGEALREAGLPYRARPRMEVHFCRLTDGWDAYEKTRSRNWRHKMRYKLNVLQRAGEVRLLRYRPAPGAGTEAEHAEIYRLCEQIAEKTWQADDQSQSTLCSRRVRDLLYQVHLQAAALGMLDANILLVGDKPAAFNYNYIAQGRIYGLRCGYDPTLGQESCGLVLLYKMLEDSCGRGDVEYNFGPGRQPYKVRFGTHMRYAYTFKHYARFSLRSQLMHLKEEFAARLLTSEALRDRGLVT